MELSQEIQDILQKYQPQRLFSASSKSSNEDELIDVEALDFSNDQTWLVDSAPVDNLSGFLYCDTDLIVSTDSDTADVLLRKPFDSRTFTRPKKKLNRPSIEKYNEDYFADETYASPQQSRTSLAAEIDKYMSISSAALEDSMRERPLHFDLSQPISTSIFEAIVSNAGDTDSFQNMSPPSLVNSMCSSTFTNLMENSYIKNDPVLREIRDADYSGILYQELDQPLYQSISESCSSINTEVAENFVRRTLSSLNSTFSARQNETNSKAEEDAQEQFHMENIDPNTTISPLNGTYRKPKLNPNRTFDAANGADDGMNRVNATFDVDVDQIDLRTQENVNTTFAITQTHKNTLNNTYRRDASPKPLNSTFVNKADNCNTTRTITSAHTPAPKIDNYMIDAQEEQHFNDKTKRLSDEIDDFLTSQLNGSMNKEKEREKEKEKEERSYNQYSAESTDSLDRLSSISNCSRESKRMAEVDAIVEQQERSLAQVMSTPKPAKSLNKLFEHAHLSPIPTLSMKEHLSDSEVSSEEYITVRSKISAEHTARSLNNLKCGTADVSKLRGVYTLANERATRPATGSSLTNLRQHSKISGSYSNLKTLNANLKGSYTSVRPRSMVLNVDGPRQADGGDKLEFKIPSALPSVAREPASNPNGTFVKPKAGSGLPRPVGGSTGIPRPASKIPGPRTSRLPLSKTKATSRTNLNEGYY